MKFWEAMKALEEGKKIRLDKWEKYRYICSDDNKVIVDENNNYFYDLDEIMLEDNWEIFKERHDIQQAYKDLYNSLKEVIEIENELYTDRQIRHIDKQSLYNLNKLLDELNKEYKLDVPNDEDYNIIKIIIDR